jgi:hypothetical protein
MPAIKRVCFDVNMVVFLAPIPATVVPHKIRLPWHEISCTLPEDSNFLKAVHVRNTWLKS